MIFVLSKGLYDVKKYHMKDYALLTRDITTREHIPNWVSLDTMYILDKKSLKAEPDNISAPYSYLYDIVHSKKISLLSTSKYCVMIEYDDKTDLIIFNNVTDAYKFYNYAYYLRSNAVENDNSIGHGLNINLQLLFDRSKSKVQNYLIGLVSKTFKIKKMGETDDNYDTTINLKYLMRTLNAISTAFHSLENPQVYRARYEVAILYLNQLSLAPISNLIGNAFYRLSEMVEALIEIETYNLTLQKWSISDAKITKAMHIILKLCKHDAIQRICDQSVSKIIDRLNSDTLYSNKKSIVLSQVLRLVQNEIRTLIKFRNIGSVEMISAEILHKPLKYFLTNYLHVVDHPKLDLDVKKAAMLLKELEQADKIIDKFINQISRRANLDANFVMTCIRQQHSMHLISGIISKLRARISHFILHTISADIVKSNQSFDKIYKALLGNAKEQISLLNGENSQTINSITLECVIFAFINMLSTKNNQSVEKSTVFAELFEAFTNQLKAVDASLYVTYVKTLHDFITGQNFQILEMRLSFLHKALGLALTDVQLIGLIDIKENVSIRTIEKLKASINDHFVKIEGFNKIREFKAKNSRKILTAFYCIKFIATLKRKAIYQYYSPPKVDDMVEKQSNRLALAVDTKLESRYGAKITIFKFKDESKPNKIINE